MPSFQNILFCIILRLWSSLGKQSWVPIYPELIVINDSCEANVLLFHYPVVWIDLP